MAHPTNPAYRPEIDGLRALAVAAVVLFHASFPAFGGGYVGVDVFLVISGYLITAILRAEREAGTIRLVDFWERRFRRILPALFVVMLFCVPCAWLWLPSRELKNFSQSLVAVCVYGANVLFWLTSDYEWDASGYFDAHTETKPLLHTWSLSVEEQFYVLLPVFLAVAWRWGRKNVTAVLFAAAGLSLAAAEWGSRVLPSAAFYLLPTRAWEMLIGSLLALAVHPSRAPPPPTPGRQALSGLGLGLVVAPVFLFGHATPYPSVLTLAPTLGTALVIAFARPGTLVARGLSTPALVRLGLISYSVYLWHQPLFAFARQRSVDPLGEPTLLLLIAVALGLGYLSWRYVETPFRDRRNFTRRQIFLGGLAASLGFIAVGLYGHWRQGRLGANRDPAVETIQGAAYNLASHLPCWRALEKAGSLDGACRLGHGGSRVPPAFALFGDSHAGILAASLGRLADRRRLVGADYSYIGCPPIAGIGANHENNPVFARCDTVRADFFRRLEQGRLPHTVVVVARWSAYVEKTGFDNREGGREDMTSVFELSQGAPAPERSLPAVVATSIGRMLARGHRVVLVYPVPEMGWDVPRRLRRYYLLNGRLSPADGSIATTVFRQRSRRATALLDAIGQHPNLVRIRPEALLCDTYLAGRCVAHLGGRPLYADDDHLSEFGADLVVGEMIRLRAL